MKQSFYPLLSSSFQWAGLIENITQSIPDNSITESENKNNIPE